MNRCRDGSLIDVHQVVAPVLSDEGRVTHFVSVWRDVTRERELMETARRNQRLAQLGQLAAEIAHDFQGAITGVLGFAQLARAAMPENCAAFTYVKEVLNCTHRAARLARQFLDLGKEREEATGTTDPNEVIAGLLPFLRNSLGAVSVEFEPDWQVGRAGIDRLQFEEILLNLSVNARDAMQDGGTLTIRSAETEPSSSHLSGTSRPMVRVTVEDTGCGMNQATLDHIFEPFFTTKGSSGGTGLGLSIVRGIVEDSNGVVRVESTPGKGTVFHVMVPRCSSAASHEGRAEAPARVRLGHGAVLVVEHDPSVRQMLRQMLEHLGYSVAVTDEEETALELAAQASLPFNTETKNNERTLLVVEDDKGVRDLIRIGLPPLVESLHVLTAADGDKALEILRDHRIDLIIADLKMPVMDGITFLTHVMEDHPEIPRVVITGASRRAKMVASLTGVIAVLTKPLDVISLAANVSKWLDEYEPHMYSDDVHLASIAQLISLDARTCEVGIQDKETGRIGLLRFQRGRMLDAATGALDGLEAVCHMFQWKKVRVWLHNNPVHGPDRIRMPIDVLLLEVARLLDEAGSRDDELSDESIPTPQWLRENRPEEVTLVALDEPDEDLEPEAGEDRAETTPGREPEPADQPPFSVAELDRQAAEAFRNRQYERAKKLWSRVAQITPRYPSVRHNLRLVSNYLARHSGTQPAGDEAR